LQQQMYYRRKIIMFEIIFVV